MIDWTSGNWHMGYLIGVPVLAVAALVLIALAVACFWSHEARMSDDLDIAGYMLGAIGLIAAGSLIAVLWPLDSTFHKYYRVTGKVEQVSSRMIASDKAMSQRFVVVLDGQPFAIDDTRASLLKVGDEVALQCSREYQYAGESGWSCEWGQR